MIEYTLFIGRSRDGVRVGSVEEAQRTYARLRDESPLGPRDFPNGRLILEDGRRLRISYNARVWEGEKLVAGYVSR
jgi:hypothetical protein